MLVDWDLQRNRLGISQGNSGPDKEMKHKHTVGEEHGPAINLQDLVHSLLPCTIH